MQTTAELIDGWYNTHARNAALDDVIADVRAHCLAQDEQLAAYEATVQAALNLLVDPNPSDLDKVTTLKDLLSSCLSGELLKLSKLHDANILSDESVSVSDEFVIS